MSEGVSITYNLTLDDLIKWSRQLYTAHQWRMSKIYRFGYSLIVFVIVGNLAMKYCYGILIALICPVAYYIYPAMIRRRSYANHFGRQQGLIGKHSLVITDKGIMESTERYEKNYHWAGIERIVEVPGYTYIFTGSSGAYIVPEYGIVEGDYNGFIVELKHRWEQSQKEQVTI